MKEDMMVVGITVVDDDTMKLELVPLITTKKRVNLLDIVQGGNANEIIKTIKGEQQYRSVIYQSREWCMKKQVLPFSSMTLEIDTGLQHKQRTHTT